ncbi:Eukaryotic translation initiation factor NCBP [Platanthera guangdongensis]|uniref:mRNA cap-binding protein n=1 Tax=Platanthera guangdongensis TaxID=2320717 RepID=A0ABR2MEM9_9ASPA
MGSLSTFRVTTIHSNIIPWHDICLINFVRDWALTSLIVRGAIGGEDDEGDTTELEPWLPKPGLLWERDLPQSIYKGQVLALVGDQLDYGEDICGIVLSIRFNEDILSIWNRNASDHQAVMVLRDSIKRHLKLPLSYIMEYKPHDASLRDNSSYRNTWLRG